MELKFEINLQHLSTIAVADSLWNSEEIVNKMKTYFLSETQYGKINMWDLITKDVINQVNPDSLPTILYTEVVYVATILGKKRRDWFKFCRMRNIFRDVPKESLYEHYLKKIYWTYYGTVDEEKIIRSWFHDPNCDLWKVYIMASCFCSEELVKEIWMEAKKAYKPEDFAMLYKSYGWHMAAYWNRFFSNNLENFISDINSNFWNRNFYNAGASLEENMFQLCVRRGFTAPAKKFWFELNEQGRVDEVIGCLKRVVNCGCRNPAEYYAHDHFIEIFLFLMNNGSGTADQHVIEMIGDYDLCPIPRHMARWPWVKMILPFVHYNKEFLHKRAYRTLFGHISLEKSHNESCFKNKENVIQRTLLHLWNILPQSCKGQIGMWNIPRFFIDWDVANLKKILNDKEVSKINRELSPGAYDKFDTFVKEDDQPKIKAFINLLIPTRLEKSIQLKMEIVYQHVMKCEFDLADELLKSFTRSEEEMNGFKSSIDAYLICRYFMNKKQLDHVDKFLQWVFNNQKLVTFYKQSFFTDEFTVNYVLSFWDTDEENVGEAEIQSNRFLRWLFQSVNLTDAFLKKLSEMFDEISSWSYKTERFEIMKHLIKWCSMTEEDKHILKLCDHTDYILMETMGDYMRKNKYVVAQKYLNWVFNTERQRESFMRKFLKAENSALDCKLFISNTCGSPTIFDTKPSQDEITEKMKEFIKFWMKPVIKMKRHNLIKALKEWPKVWSEVLQNEQSVKENSDSSDEFDAEGDDYYKDHHKFVNCDEENLTLFLDLLRIFEENDVNMVQIDHPEAILSCALIKT